MLTLAACASGDPDPSGSASSSAEPASGLTGHAGFARQGPPPCGQDGRKCAFISSATFAGAIAVPSSADDACQSAADAAALGGTFKAWLSDAESSPATRFTRPATPYTLVDGVTAIASSWSALTSGALIRPLDLTEMSTAVTSASVWTNTNADGTAASGAACPGGLAADARVAPAFVPFPAKPGRGIHRLQTSAGARPASIAPPHLQYFGGPIVQNPKVYAVMWGGTVDATTRTSIGRDFFAPVMGSSYLSWLREYDTSFPAQTFGGGSFQGTVTITPSTHATTVDDSRIQRELDAQIDAGHLARPDADTIYMVYFPPETKITLAGSLSCVDFCAYHGAFFHGLQPTYYSVMPDLSAAGCDTGCGGFDDPFANLEQVSSHELVETMTDPQLPFAVAYAPPLAWYDPHAADGEIADICNGLPAGILGNTVGAQQVWSNAHGGCIAGAPQSDFAVSLTAPASALLTSGSLDYTIATQVTAGVGLAAQAVVWESWLLPRGVTSTHASFTTGGSSPVTLSASAGAATGTIDTTFLVYTPEISKFVSTSLDVSAAGLAGSLGAPGGGWTSASPLACSAQAHLYCFEQ